MTFSQEVKSEILKSLKNVKGCCAASFLTAVLKSIGSLTLEYRKFSFTMESDNYDFLTVCKNLAETHLDCKATIKSYNVNVKGVAVYSCGFEGNIGDKLGLTTRQDNSFNLCENSASLIPKDDCCKKAFMQGLFLSAGSVVIPQGDEQNEKSNNAYHLELRFVEESFALAVKQTFDVFDFRLLKRKNHVVLYLKDSEKIADYLVYLGATKGKLKLETVIVDRNMRNNINRQSNCIVANIDKAVRTAERQLNAIQVLKQNGEFNNLPQQLKEIALLRENNPEATLDEIAVMLHISKSGANHRFAKLIEIANLQENK
ncbi:MAG: DNA-binding protein WhiA [Clostridia bacterium]|nr:DNA-binding protein WhiA [Clostridia bacterium]